MRTKRFEIYFALQASSVNKPCLQQQNSLKFAKVSSQKVEYMA